MLYVNLIIERLKSELDTPHCEKGVIRLPPVKSEKVWGGFLSHEAGHLVVDPVTFTEYFEGVQAIKKELSVDFEVARILANVASDVCVEFRNSRNKLIREYVKEKVKYAYNKHLEIKGKLDSFFNELFAIYKKLYNVNIPVKFRYIKWKELEKAVKTVDRKERYVKIARLFYRHFKNEINQLAYQGTIIIMQQQRGSGGSGSTHVKEKQKEGRGEGESEAEQHENTHAKPTQAEKELTKIPVNPDDEELQKLIEKLLREGNNKDIDELRKMLKELEKCARMCGRGRTAKRLNEITRDELLLLIKFFEAQARKVILQIEFPHKPTLKGVRMGSRLWQLSDGFEKINVLKTVLKYGVNIPMVTTQTDLIIKKWISDIRSEKPIDLVVSLDCSGSTDCPCTNMFHVATHEVILLYALLQLATKIGQRVGLTLWDDKISYTTLPEVLDWRSFEEIKRSAIIRWSGGNTHIELALKQAKKHKDKLFFIVTDAKIYPEDLKKHGKLNNVVFFLIKPSKYDVEMFYKYYPKHQVVAVDSVFELANKAVKVWREIFWK